MEGNFGSGVSIVEVLSSEQRGFGVDGTCRRGVSIVGMVATPRVRVLVVFTRSRCGRFGGSKGGPDSFYGRGLEVPSIGSCSCMFKCFSGPRVLIGTVGTCREATGVPGKRCALLSLLGWGFLLEDLCFVPSPFMCVGTVSNRTGPVE